MNSQCLYGVFAGIPWKVLKTAFTRHAAFDGRSHNISALGQEGGIVSDLPIDCIFMPSPLGQNTAPLQNVGNRNPLVTWSQIHCHRFPPSLQRRF